MAERIQDRQCVRPGCTRPAVATLSFRYDTRQAWLGALEPQPIPATYDLCGVCAGRTNPPRGWYLVDERPQPAQPEAAPADEATVALLAAALADDAPEGQASGDSATAESVAAPATGPAPGAQDSESVPSAAVSEDSLEGEDAPAEPEPSLGAVARTEPLAAPAAPRERVRPVMAALLGESDEPLVSLSAVPAPVAVAVPVSHEPVAAAHEPVAAAHEPEPAAPVPPTAAPPTPPSMPPPSHDEAGAAPRLFAVPSEPSSRGAASVW